MVPSAAPAPRVAQGCRAVRVVLPPVVKADPVAKAQVDPAARVAQEDREVPVAPAVLVARPVP